VAPKKRRALTPAAREALHRTLLHLRDQRDQRGGLTRAQLRVLRRLLVDSADALYRVADRVERGEGAQVPRDFFDDLAGRVARIGPTADVVLTSVRAAVAELRRRHRDRILARQAPTAKDLRNTAIQLMSQVSVVEVRAPEGHDAHERGAGRPRNLIVDQILAYADQRGLRDVDLACALADVDFIPDGPGSPHASLAERWAAILKSARARRRRTG